VSLKPDLIRWASSRTRSRYRPGRSQLFALVGPCPTTPEQERPQGTGTSERRSACVSPSVEYSKVPRMPRLSNTL
jgi:hypothetical protein